MPDAIQLQPLDPDDVDEGKLLVCESCGAVVHTDYAPTHQSFHRVTGGVFKVQ